MKLWLLIAMMTFVSAPAIAQVGERSLLCNRAKAHTPISDSVDYKGGVDVNGKPVAPADLTAEDENTIVTHVVQIPLTVDLAQWLGIDAPKGTRMESVIGYIEVDKAGHVTYDGKAIDAQVDGACKSHVTVDTDVQAGQIPPPPAVAQ